ncbi:MAG: phage head closure protein [Lachnospiraceae bacterium]|nr:phage head closure protein [Lachnospiraceae bacterium]
MVNREKSLTSILNRKMELWYHTKATDKNELGQYDVIETKLKDVWAGIIPQTGKLVSGRSGDTELTETTYKIITRYMLEIKPDMWFVYGGQKYNILYVLDPNDNHERLEIFCSLVFN